MQTLMASLKAQWQGAYAVDELHHEKGVLNITGARQEMPVMAM